MVNLPEDTAFLDAAAVIGSLQLDLLNASHRASQRLLELLQRA